MNVRKMVNSDIDQLVALERQNFPDPWTEEMFINTSADIYVLEEQNKVIGYIETMLIIDELHINNIAIDNDYKGKGYSLYLYKEVINKYKDIIGVTLEVRISNERAIGFYKKIGFKEYGIRKGYYSNPKEDAIIMWNYFKGES